MMQQMVSPEVTAALDVAKAKEEKAEAAKIQADGVAKKEEAKAMQAEA